MFLEYIFIYIIIVDDQKARFSHNLKYICSFLILVLKFKSQELDYNNTYTIHLSAVKTV